MRLETVRECHERDWQVVQVRIEVADRAMPDGQGHTELKQEALKAIHHRRSLGDQPLACAVQRGEDLLILALDGGKAHGEA